jgi:HEPN domain-containing protein
VIQTLKLVGSFHPERKSRDDPITLIITIFAINSCQSKRIAVVIYDLFSKRKSDAENSGIVDVYQYEDIPMPLRIQISQISNDAIGQSGRFGDGYSRATQENHIWYNIEKIFLRENGMTYIERGEFAGNRVLSFMNECSTEDWLDFLELIAVGIEVMGDQKNAVNRQNWRVSVEAKEAINEINYRLRQSGVGYQIEDKKIVRVDSQFIHSEVVKPALVLLSERGFKGPTLEFLVAHQHYREGKNREAVASAANAMESTFKAVFDKKGWPYPKGARISDLVKVANQNNLWPDYLDKSFDQLLGTLQSGLPKIRDNDAAHGQGSKPKEVPNYIAAYALHLAASKIVFVVEAAK